MFSNKSLEVWHGGIVTRSPFLRNSEIDVCDSSRSNFETLPEKFALRVDFGGAGLDQIGERKARNELEWNIPSPKYSQVGD